MSWMSERRGRPRRQVLKKGITIALPVDTIMKLDQITPNRSEFILMLLNQYFEKTENPYFQLEQVKERMNRLQNELKELRRQKKELEAVINKMEASLADEG